MPASHSQFPPKALLRRTASSGGSKGLFEASGALTILDGPFRGPPALFSSEMACRLTPEARLAGRFE